MSSAIAEAFAPGPEAAPEKRNIIAVASGKGGVGKTWFSITLAHALALAKKKALLFDGDLGLANVDVQLGCTPRRDLASVVSGEVTMAQAVTPHACGFDIIAGRSGSGSLASLPANRLLELRAELGSFAQNYDWVVLDLGAGIERTVRILTGRSRVCLVVTRLDMVRRLGSVIATVDALRFTLAEAGMSSAIADGLSSFNPVLLARVLLTTAVRVRRPSLEKTR